MEVTNCQVYPVREPKGTLRAFARVLLEDTLQLTALQLLMKDEGLVVELPHGPGGIPFIELDTDTLANITRVVIDEFHLNGGTK